MTHPTRRQGTHISSIGHCIRVNNRTIFTLLSFNPSNKNIDNHHFVFLSGLESQIVFLSFRSQKLSHTFVYVRQFEIFLEHIFIFRFFQPFFPDFCLVFSMTNVSLFAVSFFLFFYTESSSIVDDVSVIGNHLVVVANVDHRCRFASSYDFAV